MCLGRKQAGAAESHLLHVRLSIVVSAGCLNIFIPVWPSMQDVMDAARTLDKVMGLNIAVCEPFYQGIIRKLWAEKSTPTL